MSMYLPDSFCACKDGSYPVKMKRSTKKLRARPTPAFDRYMIKRKNGELEDPNEEFVGQKYFPSSLKFNHNTLRWRRTCGRPWERAEDEESLTTAQKSEHITQNMKKRCDQNQFLGFVDDVEDKPNAGSVLPEHKHLISVVWDDFTPDDMDLEHRKANFFKDTAYVPDGIYQQAKQDMERWGQYRKTPPTKAVSTRDPPPAPVKAQPSVAVGMTGETNASARKLFSEPEAEE